MKTLKTPRGTARRLRRHGYPDPHFFERFQRPGYVNGELKRHNWDDDGCCTVCDFDGAAWSHENNGQDVPMPKCYDRYGRIQPGNRFDIFRP